MGNTSDRASGDRHGAKAHRSDSSGSHKDHDHSSKMVDSTDDPNIFNTHGPESKVQNPQDYYSDFNILKVTKNTAFLFIFVLLLVFTQIEIKKVKLETYEILNELLLNFYFTSRRQERKTSPQIWMTW